MGLHPILRNLRNLRSLRRMVLPALALILVAAPAWAQSGGELQLQVRGHTVASETRDLALRVMDVVAKVFVKPGDVVKAGDPLIVEDTREEEVNLAVLELEADVINDLIVKAADVTLKNKEVELKRVKQYVGEGGGAASELEKAQLEVELATLELMKAKQDKEKKLLEVKLQRQRIERMKIVSPIDGIVQRIDTQEGEVIDPQRSAITVVRNDPLWVEARIPTHRALNLKIGQQLDVFYENEKQPRKAEIIYFDPVADARVSMRWVRLAMPNPENRPSGMVAFVVVPADAGHAAAPAAATGASASAGGNGR